MFKIKNLSKLLKPLSKYFYSKIPRNFTVNGVINSNESSKYFYIDPAETNLKTLIPSIKNGDFIMFYGSRGNGKSSCISRAIEQISNEFFCLFLTFQQGSLNLILRHTI
jgi:predicted AAA+ superfamily ATPase